MALLLNIDTATEVASVCVSLNGISIAFEENQHQREHASFVHAAIASVLKEAGYTLNDIEAFAVTSGPGSYTGLRVGMATAKGFCYALTKPFIMVNTLEVMAKAALQTGSTISNTDLLCPMIEARRMEVFTALYNTDLKNILSPQPLILEEESFTRFMIERRIVFFGSGSIKFKAIMVNQNGVFVSVDHNATHLGMLADKAFEEKIFFDLPYSQPTYFKDFQSTQKAKKE
ncbi:tRNA (adenosine(37)-N6)-threonylcarbamoyltransferase complex dimerization subunit type 1 TsaB [Segetibacter sp.]|uniref:tRNA (adenosine(37)-N6)-threonylcarbamoyltransferase complex dimerization subunit type 1 TsaB n=1 Tax=Segetibacter sp. TaxID=2231182 RepID=UPI0026383DF4|nr:tRNA (adenosine(37)-N6)-threonylcarbamoyltransferase complex dimerization subunit type 1 TsaB [Segetibacter sp.]MCW3082063.1 TsaB protein required for threonylcarbamoyladenosine ((6)A) formation in tRNA [Segetibacter sp.]